MCDEEVSDVILQFDHGWFTVELKFNNTQFGEDANVNILSSHSRIIHQVVHVAFVSVFSLSVCVLIQRYYYTHYHGT